MPDTRLNHVVAVARAGTFTAAASLAGVTQSAITRSIADLERQVGYSIFVRTSRGAIPTEQGRDFVERAQKLIEDTQDLLRRPHGSEDAYAGVLRIGVCPASMEFCLIEPVAQLLEKHASIRVDVNGTTFERAVQQVRNGSIDVAVGFEAAFADWPDIRRQRVSIDDDVGALFVRRGHPLLEVRRPTPKLLAKYDFVSPSDSRPYGATVKALYEDQGVDWRKRVHVVDFFPLVKKIVATTDSIGVMMAGVADRSASFRNQFVTLDTNPFSTPSPMCCAVRARWDVRPAVRAFISIMQRGSAARHKHG
ncbi:MAG: LysR family transcriptional regulator [Alphaproteobacteria bacterium]|jgi:DNA-binding transcriptional LysR family regulator|nr:LysR family transcriptional regulator [Alphaproteobacteria bacterium]